MRSIMKKNILIISLLFLTLTAGAQNAAQARKILDKTASVIGHKGGATAKFQMKGKYGDASARRNGLSIRKTTR